MILVELPGDWPEDLIDAFRKWERRFWSFHDTIQKNQVFDYVDAWRVARVGNEAEERYYQTVADSGCCGSHEEIVTFARVGKKDIKIKYGFNHGH
jgi:hypothetical protein